MKSDLLYERLCSHFSFIDPSDNNKSDKPEQSYYESYCGCPPPASPRLYILRGT
jgi:hypothetical protein